MHILFTVNTAWNLLNFRRALLEAMVADGHRVSVLAPPDGCGPALAEIGCHLLPLEVDRKGLSPIRDGALMLRIRRVLRRERPDLVLSFTIKNNIFGAFAARLAGVPFVPNVTGLGTAFLSGSALQKLVELLYRAAFARAPVVFFQNGDDQALFRQRRLVRADQARLLPGSGIDLNRFAATPMPEHGAGQGPVFLMIARVLRDKGAGEYAAAARQLKQTHPQARVQLLGPLDAENRSAIDPAEIARWQAEGWIEYLGETDDVRPFIAAADCVVLPSYREGAPRTLLEAAAMARPLIATDVPGCRAVVEDGKTGFLCAVRDADSLAQAMTRFSTLSQPEKAEMGQAGRAKIAREYDQALVIAAYRDLVSQTQV